jgi:plasmid stabilization system protein ParE
MAKRIIWSREAVADRIQILDYWYKRLGNKKYSTKLDNLFKEVVLMLSRFPFMGRQLTNREERVLVKDHYQIYYLIEGEEIKILRVWDSRRNPEDFYL